MRPRNVAEDREDRELILAVQRNTARAPLRDLQELVRKHDHKFPNESKGAERDSWRRALLLTGGWPPPAQSAAEPERRR